MDLNSLTTFKHVSHQMLKCIELDERLKAMDQEITVNPQFVQKVTRGPVIKSKWLG